MKKTTTVQVNMMNLMCGMYMCGMIFDVDGTLLDYMPVWAHSGEQYLATLGIIVCNKISCALNKRMGRSSNQDCGFCYFIGSLALCSCARRTKQSGPLRVERGGRSVRFAAGFLFY